MNIKKIAAITISTCMFLTSSISVLAAPKQMADGTMFDAEFYAQTYPDVATAVGTDEAALYNHYVQCGKAEGRKATADGTTQAATQTTTTQPAARSGRSAIYRLSSKQMKDLLWEVFDTGSGEGAYFDEVQYAAAYPDIAAKVGTSHNALWKHYKTKGIYEGRQAFAKNIYGNFFDDANKSNILILNAAITLTDENMSDREICKIAHDWICSHLSFSPTGRMGVHLGVGDCEKYTESFRIFVTSCGIKNDIIKSSTNAVGHAWNIVWVDGHRYEIDCQYDDMYENIIYDYFLVEKAH